MKKKSRTNCPVCNSKRYTYNESGESHCENCHYIHSNISVEKGCYEASKSRLSNPPLIKFGGQNE